MLAERRLYAQLKEALRARGVPGYAGGVRNAPGGWAMVGEQGPELMRVPAGADIIPNNQMGGMGGIVIQPGAFVFNWPIMDSPYAKEQIADLIGDALMRRYRAGGSFVPSGA